MQILAVTGKVTYGAAVPIIMGQNIGTCVTAMLSAVGANKNAKRAALVHLSFNVIGSAVWLLVFYLVKVIFHPLLLDQPASLLGIAIAHSIFNVLCTMIMLPLSGLLEKLVTKLVPDTKKPEIFAELDERLLTTPPIALDRCRKVAADMAKTAVSSLKEGMDSLQNYSVELAESIRKKEEKTDHYEDILGTYLVKLSTRQVGESSSREAAKLLKVIGDYERISDHAVNLLEAAEELRYKELQFTETAKKELAVISLAVNEILDLSLTAFLQNDLEAAFLVEPLEQVIDELKEQMRTSHIMRMQQEECSIDAGFVWSDLLTDLERTSDHCSNIAGCVVDVAHRSMNFHESLRKLRNNNEEFKEKYQEYTQKYVLR